VTTELVSDRTFHLWLTAMVGGIGVWLVWWEVRNLLRLRGKSTANPSVRDQYFGYISGLVIAAIAIVGTLRYNHVL
jgi:hypothetical protein